MCAARLHTAAVVACAEGVGTEVAAVAELQSKSEGLAGLKAHVVVANWALDVAGCFARATGTSSYARHGNNFGLLEVILLVLKGFGGGTEARSRVPSTSAGRIAAVLRGNRAERSWS